jgi:hypothetical protein
LKVASIFCAHAMIRLHMIGLAVSYKVKYIAR